MTRITNQGGKMVKKKKKKSTRKIKYIKENGREENKWIQICLGFLQSAPR